MFARHTSIIAITAAMLAAPAFAQTGPSADAEPVAGEEIIVTGTRASGITAAESAAPIKVLSSEALEHVGQPNLNQVLTQLVPSFTAEAFGGDTANLTLSARLRGLSPNHALVLVNGKRRHGTSNLHVLGGPYQGAVSPDLDLIPPGAIDHIEVLEDGAAAQYGSDAIAGVINIILKKTEEISGSVTAGQYYKSDGETYAGTLTLGTHFGEGGYANLTMFHRYHNFSQRGGVDSRIYLPSGAINTAGLGPVNSALAAIGLPGAPYTNKIVGDARSRLTNLFYNAGYDFGGVEVYTFGSYGHRNASAFENYRQPWRVSRTGTGGQTILFNAYGFNPREATKEDDYSVSGGIKGDVSEWHWDLSSTYGSDKNTLYTLDSANNTLFNRTGGTPTDFYDGFLKADEWTTNLDITHEFEVGLAKPLNLAFGGEYRENKFTIGKGDFASTYFEGGQSYPGFLATDAGAHKRHNVAGYVDLAILPVDAFKIDVAGRYEDYSDFGTRWTGKITSRYDFSDQIALRGTVSTGFRAPSLLEEYYSATNVGPSTAYVQLPPNSAAAKLLGYPDLKPEKSTNFSLGAVIRPIDRLTITIDAYQVKVKDRIVGTGSIVGLSGGVVVPVTGPRVLAAIAAHGNVLDPVVLATGDAGINLFANGADTRTRGIDVTASYPIDIGAGRLMLTLSGNYNTTKITKLRLPDDLYAADARSIIEDASPKYKIIAGGLFTLGAFSINARETFFGKASQVVIYNGTTPTLKVGASAITDLDVNYDLTKAITVTLGANNLFNKKTDTVPIGSDGSPINGDAVLNAPVTFSPYGINGGYYYARIAFKF
jgi:iron complex outermembrane receptor protein